MGLLFLSSQAAADCTTPSAKAGAREDISGTAHFCDGQNWVPMFTDGSAGACSVAGRWDWHSGSSAYTHCNGANLIRIRAPSCTVSALTYRSRRTSADLNVANVLEISPDGTKAYVGSQFGGKLVVMDISASPAAPTILGVTADNANAGDWTDSKLVGNWVFGVARGGRNFFTVNVANPAAPAFSGRLNLPTQMQNIWSLDTSVDGTIAYAIGWASGPTANRCILHVINTTNPASPTSTAIYDITNAMGGPQQYCNQVRRFGNKLLISFADGGIAHVSIANPVSPVFQAYTTHANAGDIEFSAFSEDGNTLYAVTNASSRFYSWNVSGTTPTYLTNFQDTTRMQTATALTLRGRYAFVAGKTSNYVSMVDVATPSSPSVAVSTNNANITSPEKAVPYGRYLYITSSDGADALNVFDMGCDPISTANLGSCSTARRKEYFPDARAYGYCDGSAYRVMGKSRH